MLEPGSSFAGYTIERLLGAGGMGEVYVAHHPRLPRFDALKVLAAQFGSDDGFRRRFEREAAIVAGLSHPGIVAIHDRGETDGRLWIAFELVDGSDLTRLIESAPHGVPTEQVAGIVGDTVSYASPEQLTGRTVDARSDQYSLACTAFHLLTGRVPFADPNVVNVITAHLNAPPPSVRAARPDVAPAVDAVLARALAKDPGQRFASSGEFAAVLANAAAASNGPPTMYRPSAEPPIQPHHPGPQFAPTMHGGQPVVAHQPAAGQAYRPAPGRTRRRRVVVVSIGAAVVLVVALVVTLAVSTASNRSGPSTAAGPTTVTNDLPRNPVSTVLGSLANRPGPPKWSIDPAAVGLSRLESVRPVGGDERTVYFANYLGHKTGGPDIAGRVVAVDAATGRTLWPKPAELTEREGIWGCKFPASRKLVGCYADSKVLILAPATGAIRATYRDLEWRPGSLDVDGELFVITGYRGGDADPYFARGLNPDASVRWTHSGEREFASFGEQGVVVLDDAQGSSKKFVVYRTSDGRPLFTGTSGEYYSWIVFPGGFAVSAGAGNVTLTVFDAYTGAVGLGFSVSFSGIKPVEYLIGVDDQRRLAIALDEDQVAAYDTATGTRLWASSGSPGVVAVGDGVYLGTSRIV